MIYQLNLLSKERKQRLKVEMMARSGASLLLLFALISLGASLGLYAASFMLKGALAAQQKETQRIADATRQQQGQLPQERIRQLNALATRSASIQQSHVAIAPLLAIITALIPDGIAVETLDINAQQLSMTMTGTAATRQALLALEANFTSSEKLSAVTSPVTNFLTRENIPFSISATFLRP